MIKFDRARECQVQQDTGTKLNAIALGVSATVDNTFIIVFYPASGVIREIPAKLVTFNCHEFSDGWAI